MNKMQREELHELVRTEEARLRAIGLMVDKKLLRYNDCVEAAIRYGLLGGTYDQQLARAAIPEIVSTCFKDTDMYVPGRGPLTLISDWMIPWLV